MTYSVKGEAHGATFDETGFTSREAAEAYASQAIDGDTESTIEVIQEDGRDAELARLFRNFHDQVAAMNQEDPHEQNRRWAALEASVPCGHAIPGTCDYCGAGR